MTEVFKGQSNLSQLEIRGNYRAVAAHDMANEYSRNLANRQIFASRNLARWDFRETGTSILSQRTRREFRENVEMASTPRPPNF